MAALGGPAATQIYVVDSAELPLPPARRQRVHAVINLSLTGRMSIAALGKWIRRAALKVSGILLSPDRTRRQAFKYWFR